MGNAENGASLKGCLDDCGVENGTDPVKATEFFETQNEVDEEAAVSGKDDAAKLIRELVAVRNDLGKVVIGQDHAINSFITGYYRHELSCAMEGQEKVQGGIFLFAGPPGVGKTFLVKNIVKLLKGRDGFKQFDMTEYAKPRTYERLIGYDDNYKAPAEGLLTGFVKEHPRCILLFDEFEKAAPDAINLFLKMLDERALTDAKTNERVSFKEAMIFFTSNVGKSLYDDLDSYNPSGLSTKVVLKALQQDVNPETKEPYFSAALCSRLASSNVVMFNHMSASILIKIAELEIKKQVELFKKKYGIEVDVSPDVFAALVFEEGQISDARGIRGRAERFFSDEVFELLRFVTSDQHEGDIKKLKTINFCVELPEDEDIVSLFKENDENKVLIFSTDKTIKSYEKCRENRIIKVDSIEQWKEKLFTSDLSFAIIELPLEVEKEKKFINIVDIDSYGRDAFWYIREKYSGIPVYILYHYDNALSEEERNSYLKDGARGFIVLDEEQRGFADKIDAIFNEVHQQASFNKLVRANRRVKFESGQRISPDGEKATITLFDFETDVAVDAEDTRDIMSNVSKPNVRFEDIIGADNAKDELKFFVDYLKNPKRFVESGLRAPRGALLYGPPGTGKTLLAKAVANQAGVTFISAEGNQFLKRYVGEGKDNLHELFAVARKYAPSILFIDEIEVVAREREGGNLSRENGEDVLTALLTEMDGFNTDITRPVFVLAATNFDITPGSAKSLDRALLRRFDSKIYVELPNKKGRIDFINKKKDGSKAFDISDKKVENIALRSTGLSLSELDSIMELSLRMAIRKSEQKVTDEVFDEAFESYIGGEKKDWDVSQLERVARHEAGHMILCWKNGEVPSYVTIVARGNHGGYMMHNDKERKQIFTKEELLSKIRTSLGGRAAEMVCYRGDDGISTGASGDLQVATSIAKSIVCSYGMDYEFGIATVDQLMETNGAIAAEVRSAVNQILEKEMEAAISVIRENRKLLDSLVEKLMEDNYLDEDDIKSVFENAESI